MRFSDVNIALGIVDDVVLILALFYHTKKAE